MEKEIKEKRRRFSRVQKKRILEAFNSGQMTCTELAGQHRISPVFDLPLEERNGQTKAVLYEE